MRFQLVRARRDGVTLSKSNRPKPDQGSLKIAQEQDSVLGRYVMVARFMGDRQHELINAELVRLEADEMILSGLERRYSETGGRADYAQTWVVKMLP